MAVTNDSAIAERMRVMSLHGLSKDAWQRFSVGASWKYEIVAPGFKYNMTDVASALGVAQLGRALEFWHARQALAETYSRELASIEGLELPREGLHRQHSWHLYAVRLRRALWPFDRDEFIARMSELGVSCSVHYMPLHLHPYYRTTYGYQPGLFPVAEQAWEELVSLPIFPGMTSSEIGQVIACIRELRQSRS